MNNWASVNDASEIEEMGEMQKNQGNKGTREPSSPVSAYSKVTKNMWVIYFNPNDAHKIEENAKSWDNISDADREYRYQQVEKRLKVLNDQIGTLDENIKKELDIIESRRIEKQKMSALYGDEAGMKSRLNKIKEEKQKIKDEQNEINTTPLSPSATEVEKDMVDWKLKNLDSQDTTLTTESAEIEKVLKSDELDKISLEKMQNWKEEQIKLIESKKEVEASQVKSKSEYEAERELESKQNKTLSQKKKKSIELDKASGKNFIDRTEWQKLLVKVIIGDIIVIKELDRLGRNNAEIKETFILLKNKGVYLEFLDQPLLNTTNKSQIEIELVQPIILHLLGYFAEKEREKIKIRQKEAYDSLEKDSKGRKISRKKNKVVGRPNKIEKILQDNSEIIKLWIEKKITTKKTLEILNISRSSLFRIKNDIKGIKNGETNFRYK